MSEQAATVGDWLSSEDAREVIARAVYHHAGLPRAWALLGDGKASWLSIADHVSHDLIELALDAEIALTPVLAPALNPAPASGSDT